MESYKVINKALVKAYGTDNTGLPHYRLIQNGRSLTEKRIGTYRIHYGHIFIREEHGMLEVQKYNYLAEGLWILEKLYYTTNPELTTKETYEPIWVFRDPKTGGYQRPVLNACLYLIETALKGIKKPMESADEQKQKSIDTLYEMLGGDATVDGMSLGSGISLAGLDIPK